MSFSASLFARRFAITERDLESYLSEALSAGGEYADLYFEYLATSSIGIDEGIVRSATQGVTLGVGVRVIAGERTGYAYSDDLSPEKIRKAARVAAHIARGPATVVKSGFEQARPHDLYPMLRAPNEMGLPERVDLVKRADRAARAYDSRVFQVQATYADSLRHVLVATSEGRLSFDRQPMARMSVMVLARQGDGAPQHGYSGGGGRVTLDFFLNEKTPEDFAREAARQAIVQLDAIDAPAGEMAVVLGAGWPGILLHEAVGHGLEGDFHRKKTSMFTHLMGQTIASPGVTVVDDGTMADRRGSLTIDDEGTPTQRNVLIENGKLVGLMQDRQNARLMGVKPTGNGRRQSHAYAPMPRMTNTIMLGGTADPQEIIGSVKKGLYCANFGGGQVDIVSGKFVFTITEGYLIENGKLGAPVKGATLIGAGSEALTKVGMVGNDMALDPGIGTCGKDGQGVPVGVGQPTLRIDALTVGGTATG